MRTYEEVLRVAREAASAASAIHQLHVGRLEMRDWGTKGVADYVSHVDHEAEEAIVSRVQAHFPDDGMLAEEREATADVDAAEWLWVVDPLDGTTNFLHSYPMYGVSIAVLHGGEPVVAVARASHSGEEWTAVAGHGARLNGAPISVSSIPDLSRALVGTGFPFRALDTLAVYQAEFEAVVRATSGVRRAGSAALDLCHTATGYFDAFWEHLLSPWDFAAGTLLIQEAGGIVSRMDGSAVDLRRPGSILAGNPAIHAALLELFAR
jgi:myo-inositol-1(or 4)-monophosphatase